MYNALIEMRWMNHEINAQMHDALNNKKKRNLNIQKDAPLYNAQDVKRWMYTNVDARTRNLPIYERWMYNKNDAQK